MIGKLGSFCLVAAMAVAVSACAQDGPGGSALTTGSLSSGGCKGMRRQLDALDSKGVRAKIERANAGRRISAADRAAIARYNAVLDSYLGRGCAN